MWPLATGMRVAVVAVAVADLVVGDVVALVGPRPGVVLVHRLIAIAPDGLHTRGDTNLRPDLAIAAGALLGRVERVRWGPLELSIPTHGPPARVWRRTGLAWGGVAPNLRTWWSRRPKC